MKVLKPQSDPPGSWRLIVHHSCGAELEIEEADLVRNRYSDARESWDICEYKCPECQYQGEIASLNISSYVLARIKSRPKYNDK